MSTLRSYHTATLLLGGKVLVVGGTDGTTALNSAEVYDPALNTWSKTGNLSTARRSHTATLLTSGKVLITGGFSGYNSGSYLSSSEMYDPASNTWSMAGNLANAREYHTATLLSSGKVLVAAGAYGSSTLNSAELYDPVSNTWSAAGSLSTARDGHTATLLSSGKVLVAGGYLTSAEIFDPVLNTWSAAGSLNTARGLHTATLMPDGKVIVTGGNASSVPASSTEIYDPVLDKWSKGANLISGRLEHTATLLNSGKVLVAGGSGVAGGIGYAFLSSAELYDPAGLVWSTTGSLSQGREMHTATLLPSGKVLIAGGDNGNTFLSSAEIYDPGTLVISTGATATPNPAGVGQTVSFNVAATDSANSALTYAWDFGDTKTGSGASATHSYASTGTFTAKVTVTNAAGLSVSSSVVVTVSQTPVVPLVLISPASANPADSCINLPITFSALANSSNNQKITYAWDFGDGSSGFGASVTHPYSAAGTYTAVVIISGGQGAPLSSTVQVTVHGGVGTPFFSSIQATVDYNQNSSSMVIKGSFTASDPLQLNGLALSYSIGGIAGNVTLDSNGKSSASSKPLVWLKVPGLKKGHLTSPNSKVTFVFNISASSAAGISLGTLTSDKKQTGKTDISFNIGCLYFIQSGVSVNVTIKGNPPAAPTPDTFTLNVTTTPIRIANVLSTPDGINGDTDPSISPATMSATFKAGESVILTYSIHDPNYVFKQWTVDGVVSASMGGLTVIMNANHSVVLTLEKPSPASTYTLDVFTSPINVALVKSTPGGINGDTDPTIDSYHMSGAFTADDSVLLTYSIHDASYTFKQWTVDGVPSASTGNLTVTMNSNHVVKLILVKSTLPPGGAVTCADLVGNWSGTYSFTRTIDDGSVDTSSGSYASLTITTDNHVFADGAAEFSSGYSNASPIRTGDLTIANTAEPVATQVYNQDQFDFACKTDNTIVGRISFKYVGKSSLGNVDRSANPGFAGIISKDASTGKIQIVATFQVLPPGNDIDGALVTNHETKASGTLTLTRD